MEQIKEAVYLINDERYLHLRENGTGVGFATYNKVTGEPLESGQISEKNLPPDGRNAISAARNWYLFELSDDDRKVIQQESVKILENIPQAGIGRRRIWEPETLPKDIQKSCRGTTAHCLPLLWPFVFDFSKPRGFKTSCEKRMRVIYYR